MLLDLPHECGLEVLKRLAVADLVGARCCCSALKKLVDDDQFWKRLAEAKWGKKVLELKQQADADRQKRAANSAVDTAETGPLDHRQQARASVEQHTCASNSWMSYCCKRMCLKTIRPSPLQLLQESYPDPWQHIICCVLCSRTSGSSSIRQCIAAFFEAFPTPTACLEASDGVMSACTRPLGLMQSRIAAVKAVSEAFLATDWQEPCEFRGCGKFVTDSWRIFCTGCHDAKGIGDAKLKQYLAWANRQQPDASHKPATLTAAKVSAKRGSGSRGKACSSSNSDIKQQDGKRTMASRTRMCLRSRASAAAGTEAAGKALLCDSTAGSSVCRATASKRVMTR